MLEGRIIDHEQLPLAAVFTLLGNLGRQLEYRERIAVGIAELEVSTCRNGDVLLAVDLIANWWRVDAGAKVVAPDEFARRRVEGIEPTIAFAHEDEIPGGRECPADEPLGALYCQAIFPVSTSSATKGPF